MPAIPAIAYPFPGVVPFYGVYGSSPPMPHRGDWTPDLMNGNVAHICARNLSKETSFTFQFRMGVEIQLDPSSTLTPQLKLSPQYDKQALDTYFAISRELKDGYPADYNCVDKMWGVLRNTMLALTPKLLATMRGGQRLVPNLAGALDALPERTKNRMAATYRKGCPNNRQPSCPQQQKQKQQQQQQRKPKNKQQPQQQPKNQRQPRKQQPPKKAPQAASPQAPPPLPRRPRRMRLFIPQPSEVAAATTEWEI